MDDFESTVAGGAVAWKGQVMMGDRWINDLLDLVVICKKRKGSTPNVISLISEDPGRATRYLWDSPQSGRKVTIYFVSRCFRAFIEWINIQITLFLLFEVNELNRYLSSSPLWSENSKFPDKSVSHHKTILWRFSRIILPEFRLKILGNKRTFSR